MATNISQQAAVDNAVEVLRKRVDRFGVAEPLIQPQGENRILIQMPGVGEDVMDSVRTAIQKAAPWTHFGTGNSEIDMQLPPGMHKLTLEVGDDLHRAVEGLCTSITVNVTE